MIVHGLPISALLRLRKAPCEIGHETREMLRPRTVECPYICCGRLPRGASDTPIRFCPMTVRRKLSDAAIGRLTGSLAAVMVLLFAMASPVSTVHGGSAEKAARAPSFAAISVSKPCFGAAKGIVFLDNRAKL